MVAGSVVWSKIRKKTRAFARIYPKATYCCAALRYSKITSLSYAHFVCTAVQSHITFDLAFMFWLKNMQSFCDNMVGVHILNRKSLHRHGCALTIQARSIFSGSAFWQTETEEEERHMPWVPSLKACLFLKKIKALDRHERHSLCNLLSIHSQQHQQRKTRLFSLGNPGKHPRQFFQQANTLGSPNPLHGEMTCLSACCVLSFKSWMIRRCFVFFPQVKKAKAPLGLGTKSVLDLKSFFFNVLSNYFLPSLATK